MIGPGVGVVAQGVGVVAEPVVVDRPAVRVRGQAMVVVVRMRPGASENPMGLGYDERLSPPSGDVV